MSVDIINAAKSAFFFGGGGVVSVLETWGNCFYDIMPYIISYVTYDIIVLL